MSVEVVKFSSSERNHASLAKVQKLCTDKGKKLVSVRSGPHIDWLFEEVKTQGGDVNAGCGFPLAYDKDNVNKYYDLTDLNRELTPMFDALRAEGKLSGDYHSDQTSQTQHFAGIGWGAKMEDWGAQHCTQGAICEDVGFTWDFEDGTLQGFALESGDCHAQPYQYLGADSRWNSGKPAGGGTYYINTYPQGGDPDLCDYRDRSHRFVIGEQTQVEFYYSASANSVYLMQHSNDAVLKQFDGSHNGFTLQHVVWSAADLASFIGITAYLRFDDHGTGGWEHIQLDNLRVTNAAFVGR